MRKIGEVLNDVFMFTYKDLLDAGFTVNMLENTITYKCLPKEAEPLVEKLLKDYHCAKFVNMSRNNMLTKAPNADYLSFNIEYQIIKDY